MPFRFGTGDPAWFANIGDRPDPRAGRKGHVPQALVVDSLVHANRDISFLETRLSQLISIAVLGKLPDTVPLKKFQRHLVVRQVLCLIRRRDRAARKDS
jgi:hypothetical protein